MHRFKLEEIDNIREDILSKIKEKTPYTVNKESEGIYGKIMSVAKNGKRKALENEQEGLAIKTYQSDLLNNWISTEWLDGENGINAVTAVSTEGDEFTLDTLNIAKKVYYMLNRIAVSDGSYDDWQQAVYDQRAFGKPEIPMYVGGASKEIMFQQVISNYAATDQPLGTLAGRGIAAQGQKGGYIDIEIHEPSYLIGIISITPRLTYTQGNDWDNELLTMDDFHKPQLDQIGFQDLTTNQMAGWAELYVPGGGINLYSAGKQPAWINYMTNIDTAHGNFAAGKSENYMILDRSYTKNLETVGMIEDVTTYIDPTKYNNTFADTKLSAMNFWVEVEQNITARRKMSAKIMPNL